MPSAASIGQRGEALARQYLQRQGYRIRACNWHSVYGELDIVVERGQTIVFVEVKARRGRSTESALAGISQRKQERMLSAIYEYLRVEGLEECQHWRVDVIAIALHERDGARIAHVEDAFGW